MRGITILLLYVQNDNRFQIWLKITLFFITNFRLDVGKYFPKNMRFIEVLVGSIEGEDF